MLPLARFVVSCVLALAAVSTLRAQSQIPNEGCSSPTVDLGANTPGCAQGVAMMDAGRGQATVSTYGSVERRIVMPAIETGLSGLARLYPSTLIVDASITAWDGTGIDLKSLPNESIPRPHLASNLIGEELGLQPRPGTMPGLYVFQYGNDYYQYGGPVDSGASPQTTAIYATPGDGPPLTVVTNQLSGAQLWRYTSANPQYLEIKHVDGTVARFDSFPVYQGTWTPSGPAQTLWRVTSVRDPYDNQATYSYNGLNQLTAIAFPSGITQHFEYDRSQIAWAQGWPTTGWPATHDCLEIHYTNGTSPTPPELAAKTWAMVFYGPLSYGAGRFFGARLFRTYSAVRTTLIDVHVSGPYVLGPGTEVTGQVVHEFTHDTTNRKLREDHRVHSGSPFAYTLAAPSGLPDRAILETTFHPDNSSYSGRVLAQSRLMLGETITFAYPQGPFESTPPPYPGVLRDLEVTYPTGTKRRYEYEVQSGRVFAEITTPSNDFAGRPRATHATTENAGIGGVAATDVEPEKIAVFSFYDGTCVCQKPSRRDIVSTRGGQTTTRTWNYEYHPDSKQLTKRKEPNPEAGAGGPFPAQVEWVYTYVQAKVAGQNWGAWLLASETTPDGSYTYSYSDWLDRADATQHGQMARTAVRSMSGVRIQDTLAGAASLSSSPVVETMWRNLPNLPANLPMMGTVKGMPRKLVDGDGVETVHEYSAAGFEQARIVGGDLKTTYTTDAAGNVTAMAEHADSASPAVTTFVNELAVGVPTASSSTSGGLLREAKSHFDRFGRLTIERRNNLSSTSGQKPSQHGASGALARDWIESQFQYHESRLLFTYVDRKPRDEAAGGNQFLVTQHVYAADGRLDRTVNSNGGSTYFTFDGFGTLYRTVTKDPTGAVEVKGPKRFVNPFLEVTGSYEHTGSDHLWTLVTRNGAGAITQIQEPSTAVAAGYSPYLGANYSTGGAIHQYEIDQLGRVTEAKSLDGTTLLTSRKLRHDQLHRQIWQHDIVMGFGTGDHYTAWRYAAGKASQLQSVESTGVAATTYTWNALGLLQQVRDGFGSGNTVDYTYKAKTTFVQFIDRSDLDPLGPPRLTTTSFDTDPWGNVTAVKDGTPQLVHSYAYDSLGKVDRYTDPVGRVQKFLPDALGRIVEHVRLGAGSDFIRNGAAYEDSGATDGRTKEKRWDGLLVNPGNQGNLTITHWDFAGRPFIVQNPGGDDVPTASTPNKTMCLYAEYDGASRLKTLHDGDAGKVELLRDGPGRLIQRRLVNQVIGSMNSADRIAQWNTLDWLRRDALGRIAHNEYWGATNNGVFIGAAGFDHDSLGRVHAERSVSAFAPTHTLEVKSTWSGGNPFRAELEYTSSIGTMESAKMSYSPDAIGRLSEVQWNKASGAGGAMTVLAQYGWAGGLRRSRSVRYAASTNALGLSTFTYDVYGRLTQIKDDVHPGGNGTFTTKSQFDYVYDDASNLTKEIYAKVNGRAGDRFAYDAYHRLSQAWMGVDAATMASSSNPGAFNPSQIHEHLTYGLDEANNRTTTTSQTGSAPNVTAYTLQTGAHWQGPSNRYHDVMLPGAPTPSVMEYDERGNMTYDGRFVYRYDFMNRLQEVWSVIPNGDGIAEGEKFGVIEEGALEGAQEAVKLEVPDLYTRLAREHTDPVFRNRLRATITGGVIRITPTPQGGGGRPGYLPVNGTLVLAAVYVYDAFNRRTMSILVDPSVGETQFHAWDGWRQVTQHRLDWSGTAWVATPTKQFVWGARLDELVAYRRVNGAVWESYFVLHGGQDTAAKLVDTAGNVVEQYEYDPYGRVTAHKWNGTAWQSYSKSQYGLPFLWKSIRLDEITGLLQMRHRYYSTEMGRFLSQDRTGTWGDIANFGNGYGYVGECPTTRNDPSGLFLAWIAAAVTEVVVAAVTAAIPVAIVVLVAVLIVAVIVTAPPVPVPAPPAAAPPAPPPARGPTTPGPSGPSAPTPSGPSTGGPGNGGPPQVPLAKQLKPLIPFLVPLPYMDPFADPETGGSGSTDGDGADESSEPDCEKANKHQLKTAGISGDGAEHAFKKEWDCVPLGHFDICACKDGSIKIAGNGLCGMPGSKVDTDRRWKP